MANQGQHFVAVIGGAISGSVAAEILADHGIRVAVIEQNKRPYGKIEDGLPRWHVEQRKQEYARIDARMKKPGVYFVPSVKLGRDLTLQQLFDWGFSAVILANGAWRDRELGVAGADRFVDKGLVYQNPFIYWYNHKNEKDYRGPRYETPDEALVVGGGLASIDVVKVLQLENYERALQARGIQADMHQLEKGIPAACKAYGIKPEDSGVKGCLLIYRRREQDMPLAQPPDNATPEQIAKTEQVRQKMLRLARDRYLFRFQECRLTTGLVVENGRLVGLQVAETKIEGRKAEPIPGSERELRAPLRISSIGSVPVKLSGLDMKGEYYTFTDEICLATPAWIGKVCPGARHCRRLHSGRRVGRRAQRRRLAVDRTPRLRGCRSRGQPGWRRSGHEKRSHALMRAVSTRLDTVPWSIDTSVDAAHTMLERQSQHKAGTFGGGGVGPQFASVVQHCLLR